MIPVLFKPGAQAFSFILRTIIYPSSKLSLCLSYPKLISAAYERRTMTDTHFPAHPYGVHQLLFPNTGLVIRRLEEVCGFFFYFCFHVSG